MKNCLLCQKRLADKTNSHVVPFFLIKSMVNVNGSKERDKEISFAIGNNSIDMYVGRSVTGEKVEETIGRELTDNEIESQKNQFTLDYIFCSVCENRLSHIESYYAKHFNDWTESSDNSKVSKCETKGALLFWSSVIWRISATNFAGYSLNENEEKLRKVLDETLTHSEDQLLESIKNSTELKDIGYCLAYCPEYYKPSATLFIVHPHIENPACVLINKHVFFFSAKNTFNKLQQESFWGFEKFNKETTYNSIKNQHEIFTLVNSDEFKDLLENVYHFKTKLFTERIKKLSNDLYFNFKGEQLPEKYFLIIKERIVEGDDVSKAIRYSEERISKIISEEVYKAYKSN